jgi:hypothetical protein
MAWTTPATWTALQEVTAAAFNEQIRDNLNEIWKGTDAGDLEYYTSSTAKTRLGIGTADQVLTVGGGGAPIWQAIYRFVPLTTPLTSTSFDGDSFSTTAKTSINLATAFDARLSGAVAVLAKVSVRDSASAGTDCYFMLSPNADAGSGMEIRPQGRANDTYESETLVVPCASGGTTLYYQVLATGTNTLDVYMSIWGYWI